MSNSFLTQIEGLFAVDLVAVVSLSSEDGVDSEVSAWNATFFALGGC